MKMIFSNKLILNLISSQTIQHWCKRRCKINFSKKSTSFSNSALKITPKWYVSVILINFEFLTSSVQLQEWRFQFGGITQPKEAEICWYSGFSHGVPWLRSSENVKSIDCVFAELFQFVVVTIKKHPVVKKWSYTVAALNHCPNDALQLSFKSKSDEPTATASIIIPP